MSLNSADCPLQMPQSHLIRGSKKVIGGMDTIIFGDNQFFRINHLSEEKAQAQTERFEHTDTILEVIDVAYDNGTRAFVFNTHDKVRNICEHF